MKRYGALLLDLIVDQEPRVIILFLFGESEYVKPIEIYFQHYI